MIEAVMRGDKQECDLRTFVLDRAEFERDGHARSRSKGWYYGDFYATPEAAISRYASRRDCFPARISKAIHRLDLDVSDINEGRLKKAFRKRALIDHPDHGGDECDFLRLESDYKLLRRHFGFGA